MKHRRQRARAELHQTRGRTNSNAAFLVARRDVVGVVLCCTVAALLRIAWPGCMAVEHFDEGVYASNIWFPVEAGGAYPLRRFYAPPLFPLLVELAIMCVGPDLGPMLINLVVGTCTVCVVWLTMRDWFGRQAAYVASVLIATNDVHVFYCRTALTDVLLVACVLLAIWCFSKAITRPEWYWAVLAGIATGIGWWTKYNGWLALLIAYGGCIVWLAVDYRAASSRWRRLVVGNGLMTATAMLCWLPYLIGLQFTEGGYASIARNHAQYVVGLNGWFASLRQQLDTLQAFDSVIGCCGFGTASLIAWCAMRVPSRRTANAFAFISACAMVGVAWWASSTLVLSGCALSYVWLFCAALWRSSVEDEDDSGIAHASQRFGGCLLVAWILGLALAIPCYTPYPRLTVMWIVPAILATSVALAWSLPLMRQSFEARHREKWRFAVAAVIFVLCLLGGLGLHRRGDRLTEAPAAWRDRGGIRLLAQDILQDLQTTHPSAATTPALVLTFGEPALFYQLSALAASNNAPLICQPTASLPAPGSLPAGIETYIVVGEFARRTTEFSDELAADRQRLELCGEYNYQPSDLVKANLAPPQRWSEVATIVIQIYRINQPSG